MNEVSTDKLENELSEVSDINDYLKKNLEYFVSVKLSDHLNKLLGAKNMTVADIVTASGLNKGYVYQIFEGSKDKPSRDKLLAIALAMKLEYGDIQKLLKIACMRSLYVRDERDAMIIFAVKRHYTASDTNIMLHEHGFKALE